MKNYLIVSFCLCVLAQGIGQVEVIKIRKLQFVHAQFPGAPDAMSRYLNDVAGSKIAACLRSNQRVVFTAVVDIDTTGRIEKVNLKHGSSSCADSIYVDAIWKMPLWVPATNEIGNTCKDKRFVSFNIYRN